MVVGMDITLVFFTFIFILLSCVTRLMLSISSCSPFTLLAITTLSSANHTELTKQPPTFTPLCLSIVALLIMASSYRLKSNGDSVHPCLTILPITQAFDFKFPTLTKADCCNYMFFIRLGLPFHSIVLQYVHHFSSIDYVTESFFIIPIAYVPLFLLCSTLSHLKSVLSQFHLVFS